MNNYKEYYDYYVSFSHDIHEVNECLRDTQGEVYVCFCLTEGKKNE